MYLSATCPERALEFGSSITRGCMPCVPSCMCATSPSMINACVFSRKPSVQQYANIAKQAAGSERGAGAVSHGEGMHPSNESGGIGAGRDRSAGHERGFGPLAHRCGAAIEASFGGRKRRSTSSGSSVLGLVAIHQRYDAVSLCIDVSAIAARYTAAIHRAIMMYRDCCV